MKNAAAMVLALLISIPLAVAQDTPEQVFRDLENRIAHAVMAKDATEMNRVFASDYTSVGLSGQIRSRAEVIEASSSARLVITAAQTEKITVRQYGDMAIVVGFIIVSGKDGAMDISGRYVFTRVYRRDSKEWQAVSFQATLAK